MYLTKFKKYYSFIYDISTLLKLNSDDILLAEFPKSGVTYYSFLISNYLNCYFKINRNINFFNINDFVHDIHRTSNLSKKSIYGDNFPRLVKSHTFPRLLRISKSIIIIRNPFDTLLSYFKHLKSRSSYKGSFKSLVMNKDVGIFSWIKFYRNTLRDKNPLGRAIITYESNVANPEKTIRFFCNLTGIDFSEDAAKIAINNSKRTTMLDSELKTSLVGFSKPKTNFVSDKNGLNLRHINQNLAEEMKSYIYKQVKESGLEELFNENIKQDIFPF